MLGVIAMRVAKPVPLSADDDRRLRILSNRKRVEARVQMRSRTARQAAAVQEVVRITLEVTPAGATHWSTRTLAEHLGTNASAVARIWRDHGLKPHRIESFKLSNDPYFVQKLEDIVGLYLDPPEHALVLCCDEKTQIQALDRTQPGLPLKRGRGTTMLMTTSATA